MLSAAQRRATALGLAAVLAGVSLGMYLAFAGSARPHPSPIDPSSSQASNKHLAHSPTRRPAVEEYFRGLQPELVLVLSGEMYGFLMPCGCSRPQTGGLERRAELLARLRGKGWGVSAADLGDLASRETGV
jgi:hypothetical protein